MYPALNVDEVLRCIISHFYSPKDTLNFALTCHDLLEPALDDLWRKVTLNGFDKFWTIWPVDASRNDPSNDSMVLGRVLEAHEWSRFDNYAKRIRIIKWCDLSLSMAKRPDRHLFPRVKTIHLGFHLGSAAQIHLTKDLLGRPLESITLRPWHSSRDQLNPEEGEELLFQIMQECDFISLQELTVNYRLFPRFVTPRASAMKHLSNILLGNKTLTSVSLKLPMSEVDIFEAAGTLPLLEKLEVEGYSWGTTTEIGCDRIPVQKRFPSLHSIYTDNFGTFQLIISHTPKHALTTLHITLSNPNEIQDLINSLASCASLTTLVIGRLPISEQSRPLVQTLSLEPFIYCRMMESFYIQSLSISSPSDTDLALLSTAWSKLTNFSWIIPPIFPSRATLTGLATFATHCRQLRELSIPLAVGPEPIDYSEFHPFCAGVIIWARYWKMMDAEPEMLMQALTALAPSGWGPMDHTQRLMHSGIGGDTWKRIEEKFGSGGWLRQDYR
ncbi:hypothetical protein FRB98_008808 [Tulasnella sp. 332]|nr:hypothetical protein FRB98_008808 [Tulasnella sp. 332]